MANERAVQVPPTEVAEKTETRTTAEMSAEVAKARERITALRSRAAELDESIEQGRDQLGRAMALGDAQPKLDAIRARLREAVEEREGAERAVGYLEAEAARLEAEIALVAVDEAESSFADSRAEMDQRIDELREKLRTWIESEFQPAFEAAGDAAKHARSDEMRVRTLNGSTHLMTRSSEDSWGRHVGLWAITTAIAEYGESPAAWAWKRAR